MSPRNQWILSCALATLGALLLIFPARIFSIERFQCSAPPTDTPTAVTLTAMSALVLAAAWWTSVRAATTADASLGWTLSLALLPHLVMLLSPIFLSRDALFYAAIDRVLAHYHGDAYRALSSTMDPDDPFLLALPNPSRDGTSAYFPGFHAICRAVGNLAGDSLHANLKLHQVTASVSIFLVALLSGAALRVHARTRPEISRERAFGVGFAIVLLCPLSILEATSSAHNDAEMALATTAALYAWTRGRRAIACVLVCGAILIKPTGALLAAAFVVAAIGAEIHARRLMSPRAIQITRALLAIAAVALLVGMLPMLTRVTQMFNPSHALFMSLHSPEAIPRTLLYAAGARDASYEASIAVRLAGAAWVVAISAGTLRDGRALPRFLIATYGFYVFFAGVSNAWYLLPLLAFVPFGDARWSRAVLATFAFMPLCYATDLRFQCGMPSRWVFWAVVSVTQGAIAFGASLALRVRDRGIDVASGVTREIDF